MLKRNSLGIAVFFAGTVAYGVPAGAQIDSAEPAVQAGVLEEVVVTAEKRISSEQKTPISMEVISAAEIAEKGISDFVALSTNDTSVNFSSAGPSGYLTVRGVSSHDVTEIGDPAVPIVVDDFTTTRAFALTTSLYDLERIEVLRGPQGTLYGRNAAGGLINVISRRPTRELGAGATAEYGNFNTTNFTGFLNMPVGDTLQLRVSGASRRHDGYRHILASNGEQEFKADDEDSRSLRFQANYSPSEDFNAWFLFQNTRMGGAGNASLYIPMVPHPDQVNHPGDISHERPDLGDSRSFPMYGPLSNEVKEKVYKLQLSYSGLPWGTSIAYLGGYSELEWHHVFPIPTFFGNPITTPVAAFQNETPETMNHELRLASDTSGAFAWQAGLYYFEERNLDLNTFVETNPLSTQSVRLLGFKFPLVNTKSKAGFAQASYSLNDQNKITVGARHSRDTKTRNGTFDIDVFGVFGISQVASSESSKTTYHFGYDWTPTNANLVYAKFDTGYKPGGFTTCNPYEPETVSTFEVGSKNRFNDNRIQVNVAAFHTKYEKQQIAAQSVNCLSGTVVVNAGSSKIYGLEASVDALFTDADKIDLGLSLLRARFNSFLAFPFTGAAALPSCPATETTGGVTNCQLKGNTLAQAPKATIALGYEHDWKLPGEQGLNFRIEGRYQTEQYFDAFNFGDSRQSGYGLLNAYLGYSRDKWKISIFGRNVTDKVYLVDGQEATPGGATVYRYGFGAPRTYGVRFDVSL